MTVGAPLEFHHRTLTAPSDGLDLAVEVFGSGPPLLFAHGLSSNSRLSIRQVGALAGRFRVIVFDQRGHAGSTPVMDPRLYDVRRMAEDTTAVLDALGVSQAVVCGESMGAATSLRFALSHPERVTALVLCAPALSDEPNPMREDIKAIGRAIRADGLTAFVDQNIRNDIANGASPERANAWADVLRSHNGDSLAAACEGVADWTVYQSPKDLQRLTMPVLIIAFDGDAVHPLALAWRLAAQIPHAELCVVEPASRYFEQPGTVGELIGGFIANRA